MKMEKQTPITISSKSTIITLSTSSPHYLQRTYDKNVKSKSSSPSSESSLRVPVTWNPTRSKKLSIFGLKTPSVVERVNEWMGCNELNTESTSHQSPGSVLVRREYNKVIKQDDEVRESNVREVTPLYSYLERNMKEKSVKKPVLENEDPIKSLQNVTFQQYERHLLHSGIKSANLMQSVSQKTSSKDARRTPSNVDTLSINEDESTVSRCSHTDSPEVYEVSLSPESQKKELYTYLQLMNPADKKVTLSLTNRRSVRVKNLNLLLEKKQLEQQLKQQSTHTNGHSDFHTTRKHKTNIVDLTETDDSLEGHPTLKSFKDLHINTYEVDCGMVKKDKFVFPKLPPRALVQEDFDTFMEKEFKKCIQIKTNENLCKFNGHGDIVNCEIDQKPDDEHIHTNAEKTIKRRKSKDSKTLVHSKVIKVDNKEAKHISDYKNKISRKRKLFKRHRFGEKLNALRSRSKHNKIIPGNVIIDKKLRSGHDHNRIYRKKVKKPSNKKKFELSKENIEKKNFEKPEIKAAEKCDKYLIPSCEIVCYESPQDDESIEIKNVMDDLSDLDGLSEEHRKCLIESRILSTKSPHLLKGLSPDKLNKFIYGATSPIYSSKQSDLCKDRECVDKYRNKSKSPEVVSIKKPDLHNDNSNSVEFLNWKVNYDEPMISRFEAKSEVLSDYEESNFTKEIEIINDSNPNHSVLQKSRIKENHNTQEMMGKTRKSPDSCNNIISVVDHTKTMLHDMSDDSNCSSDSSSSSTQSSSSSEGYSKSVAGPIPDHDYVESISDKSDTRDSFFHTVPPKGYEEINTGDIETKRYNVIPLKKPLDINTLHKSLMHVKRKSISNGIEGNISDSTWDSDVYDTIEKQKVKKKNVLSHSINVSQENGPILKAFYVDFNLIICQEYQVGFWTQSALGNILGAQNMWIPKGKVQRLILNDNSVQKDSAEMIISMENNIAYVELWTKEHKSDIREGPVADVFATIYFWKQGQQGLDKKVLQLENINGFGDDVQYVVLKSSQKIIVSWHSVTENTKSTYIHSYDLAADYQTVGNINEMESVSHYVSSLHNIEDCENLMMGCGENKISLWNLDEGYVVATIELNDIKSPLLTLWVKCDRGFLFTLQQCVDGELRLIAINGMNQSWKRLQSYIPPQGFDRLKGVSIENGILISFYDQGILCWNAQNGDPVVEEIPNETEYIPSGRHVIMNLNGQVIVKHALTHLVTTDDS